MTDDIPTRDSVPNASTVADVPGAAGGTSFPGAPGSASSPGAPGSTSFPGAPGSASSAHPHDGIPLPARGFASLDAPVRELETIPAVEVVSRAAVMLMSSAAEKLGLAPGEEPDIDLDEARVLITALAGLLAASQDRLGPHRQPLRDGLRTLQSAFRETSSHPDEPGQGPGEQFLR